MVWQEKIRSLIEDVKYFPVGRITHLAPGENKLFAQMTRRLFSGHSVSFEKPVDPAIRVNHLHDQVEPK